MRPASLIRFAALLMSAAWLIPAIAHHDADPKSAVPAAAAPDTLVVIVRHAEKNTGDDPDLTDAGRARAATLAAMLADANVQAIYATPFKRTRATAQPLAEKLGIAITEYDPKDINDFAIRVLHEQAGRAVLVVGHSNTVPALVRAFAGLDVPEIGDGDYGRLYVLTVGPHGHARLLRLVQP